jgi:hypothetical protein
MIPEKTQLLFTFIDYLHSNIDNFKQYDNLYREWKDVESEISLIDKKKNTDIHHSKKYYIDKIKNLKVLRDEKRDLHNFHVNRPIELKIEELYLCDTCDTSSVVSSLWYWYIDDINSIYKTCESKDMIIYKKYKDKYFETLEIYSICPFGIFMLVFDKIMWELFKNLLAYDKTFLTIDEKKLYFRNLLPKEPATPKPQQPTEQDSKDKEPEYKPRFNFTESQIKNLYEYLKINKIDTPFENFRNICNGNPDYKKIQWIDSKAQLHYFCIWLEKPTTKNASKEFVNTYFRMDKEDKIKFYSVKKEDEPTMVQRLKKYDIELNRK